MSMSAGTVYVPVLPDTSRFQPAITAAATSSLKKIGGQVRQTGMNMTRYATLPLIGLGAKAIQLAGTFEKTMKTMGAVANVPAKAQERLSDLAVKMGRDTVFSANEAAEGMLELARAGIKPARIEAGALKNTLDLAAAGEIDLSRAATIAANAMNTFGLSGKDSRVAVDALAGAANASSADISDLAMGLAQVGANAATAEWSVQETTAALAALANKGIVGSDAGTSLKTMLLSLVPTTAKARSAMQELGLDFTRADGSIQGFEEVAGQLQEKLGDLTKEQQQVALKTIFGTDAFRAAAIVMKTGADGAAKLAKETSKVGNAAEVAAAKMTPLEMFLGSAETMLLVIGQKLMPIFTQVVTKMGEWADAFTKLPDGVQKVTLVAAGLVAVLGPLLAVIGSVATIVTAGAVPFIAIAAAIGVAVVALVKLWNTSETFRNIVTNAFRSVMEYAREVWPKVKAVIQSAMQAIRAVIQRVSAIISAIWRRYGDIIRSTAQAVWNGIKSIINGALTVIRGILDAVTAVMEGDWSAFGDALKTIIRGAWEIIKGLVGAALGVLRGIIGAGARTIAGIWSAIWGGIKNAFGAIWDWMVSVVSNAIARIKSLIDSALGPMDELISKAASLSAGGVRGFLGGVVPGAGMIPKIPGLADGGIVTKPTLALIGEAGPEAVVPLRDRDDRMVAALAGAGGAGGGITIPVKIMGNVIGVDDMARQLAEGVRLRRHIFGDEMGSTGP